MGGTDESKGEGSLTNEQVIHAMSMDDAYRVERELARNALGDVTELVTMDGSGPFVRKRFPSERAKRTLWAAFSECRSAHLPRVWATYEMPDQFVVVLDFVPGEPLSRHVSQAGALPAREVARIALGVCDAVATLNERGIVHRDVAPANVVVSETGCYLIDLGIAKLAGDKAPRDTSALGTWGFASPEQHGFAQTDAHSDVYSIGRLVQYMLTGENPAGDDPQRAQELASRIPPRIGVVIERACAFEPSARYQTARDLAAALEAALAAGEADGQGVSAENPSTSAAAPAAPAVPVAPAENPVPPAAAPASPAGKPMPFVGGAAPGAVPACATGRAKAPRRAVVVAVAVALTLLAVAGAGAWLWLSRSEEVREKEPAAREEESSRDGLAGKLPADALASAGSSRPGSGGGADAEGILELAESGWSAGNGYVHYAVALSNTSDELRVDYPAVKITGYDADGGVLFTSEAVCPAIYPGEELCFAGRAGNGTPPATVEFEPVAPDEWMLARETGSASAFEVSNVSEVEERFSGTAFTGEVGLVSEGAQESAMGEVCVSVVLRDADGAIVYGDVTFATMPELGEKSAFETMGSSTLPDYETIEVYAQAW